MPSLDLTKLNTSYVVNAIRERASENFKNNVPVMENGNGLAMAGAILNNGDESIPNEFIKGLIAFYVNPIVTGMYYNNHLKEFKMPLQGIGAGFVEYYVPPTEGTEYDASGATAFSPKVKNFKNKIYKVGSRREFKETIYYRDLYACFANESGAYELIDKIVQGMMSGIDSEEYVKSKEIFTKFNTATAFPIVAAADNTPAGLMKKVREVGLSMQFPTTIYNAAGYKQTTPADSLVVFTTPQFISEVDVDLLATAFNMDRTDWVSKVVVVDALPEIATKKVKCLIGDKRFLKIRDLKYKWTTNYNAQGDFANIFCLKDTIYEASPFVNMCAITAP